MTKKKRQRKPTIGHWFLDRWVAEMTVLENRTIAQAAQVAGVSSGYVYDAIKRVHGGICLTQARMNHSRNLHQV